MPETAAAPDAAQLGHAFADPVLGAQRTFRSVLAAMAEPGTIHTLTQAVEAPAALHRAAAALLLTLADMETPVFLAPSLGGAAAAWVRFHCSTPIVEAPAAAVLAVVDPSAGTLRLADFEPGDDRYPDRSATLLVQVPSLEGGTPVRLSGPGIETERCVAPAGLGHAFWVEVGANHARYPLGVDLVLVAGDRIMGLPRSTRAAAGETR